MLEAGYDQKYYTPDEPLDIYTHKAVSMLIAHIPFKQDAALEKNNVKENSELLTIFNDYLSETKKMNLFSNYAFLHFLSKKIESYFLEYALFDRDELYLYMLIDLVYENLQIKEDNPTLKYTKALQNMILSPCYKPNILSMYNDKCSRKIVTVLITCMEIGCDLYGDVFRTYIKNIRKACQRQDLNSFVAILDEELCQNNYILYNAEDDEDEDEDDEDEKSILVDPK
ncbi:MAG: hypothetical protein HAW62_02525 [Endozoicomonadaceae bacterium]|nr:hypothetical protein [Endozoicomonadaceae bacterium]